jgi:hypothetical protein
MLPYGSSSVSASLGSLLSISKTCDRLREGVHTRQPGYPLCKIRGSSIVIRQMDGVAKLEQNASPEETYVCPVMSR